MKIWIRSQNKEYLVIAEKISYFYTPPNFYISINGIIVGYYSTKEKASKVLDMIQNHINKPTYLNHLAGEDTLFGKEVFQMPQDYEVI